MNTNHAIASMTERKLSRTFDSRISNVRSRRCISDIRSQADAISAKSSAKVPHRPVRISGSYARFINMSERQGINPSARRLPKIKELPQHTLLENSMVKGGEFVDSTEVSRRKSLPSLTLVEEQNELISRRKFRVLPQIASNGDNENVDLYSNNSSIHMDECMSDTTHLISEHKKLLRPILKSKQTGRRLRLSARVSFLDNDERRASIANENSLLMPTEDTRMDNHLASSDIFRIAMSEFSHDEANRETAKSTCNSDDGMPTINDTPYSRDKWECVKPRTRDGVICSTVHSDTPRRRCNTRKCYPE